MRSWLTHAYNDMKLESAPDPTTKPGWAVVEVLVAQPSVTEVQLFKGQRSNGYETVANRLALGPQQLFGHEFCGRIAIIEADNAAELAVGDRVSATHSHYGTIGRDFPGCFSELVAVPIDALAQVPNRLSDWEAAALQPLSSCVMNVRDLGITLGDTVVIFGQGVMGLTTAQFAKAAGAELVIGVDPRADVLDVAKEVGVDVTVHSTDGVDVAEAIQAHLGSDGADYVIEAAGGSPTVGLSGGRSVADALAVAGRGSTILSVAHYHAPIQFDLNLMRKRRLTYTFPQRLAGKTEMELAARMVANGSIQLDRMITHKLEGIEHLLEAFKITADKASHSALNPAQVRFIV